MPEKEEILVNIGDTDITVSDFNERIENLPERYRDIVKKRKKEYLEEFINDTLLYREAVKKDIHKDSDVRRVIEEAKKKILIARLLKDEVDDAIDITPEDIELFYNENSNLYMTPEIMRVSHILVPSREEADELLDALKREGAVFEDVARAKSVDPTAQRGGDIGYFPKGQLMPEFENACSVLEIGETSGVVKTKLGYHIIKLTDRKPPKLKPMEQVSDNIRSRLRAIKRQVLFNSLLARLRDETEIVINEEVLSEDADAGDTGSDVKDTGN